MRICPLAVVITLLSAWAWAGEPKPPLLQVQGRDTTFLQVEQVAKAPDSLLEKPIAVQGVVAGVNAKRHLFSLIGVKEYEQCRVLDCAGVLIVVRYQGAMPKPGSKVVVEGKMVKEKGKFLVAARNVR